MALNDLQTHGIPSDDELDDILNGIAQGRDIPSPDEHQLQVEHTSSKKTNAAGTLGIDEEIIITKKRIPIPKLNDERLLSGPGIPRLRKISKERLRFKGKGHEVRRTCFSFFLFYSNLTIVRRYCPHAQHVSVMAG